MKTLFIPYSDNLTAFYVAIDMNFNLPWYNFKP